MPLMKIHFPQQFLTEMATLCYPSVYGEQWNCVPYDSKKIAEVLAHKQFKIDLSRTSWLLGPRPLTAKAREEEQKLFYKPEESGDYIQQLTAAANKLAEPLNLTMQEAAALWAFSISIGDALIIQGGAMRNVIERLFEQLWLGYGFNLLLASPSGDRSINESNRITRAETGSLVVTARKEVAKLNEYEDPEKEIETSQDGQPILKILTQLSITEEKDDKSGERVFILRPGQQTLEIEQGIWKKRFLMPARQRLAKLQQFSPLDLFYLLPCLNDAAFRKKFLVKLAVQPQIKFAFAVKWMAVFFKDYPGGEDYLTQVFEERGKASRAEAIQVLGWETASDFLNQVPSLAILADEFFKELEEKYPSFSLEEQDAILKAIKKDQQDYLSKAYSIVQPPLQSAADFSRHLNILGMFLDSVRPDFGSKLAEHFPHFSLAEKIALLVELKSQPGIFNANYSPLQTLADNFFESLEEKRLSLTVAEQEAILEASRSDQQGYFPRVYSIICFSLPRPSFADDFNWHLNIFSKFSLDEQIIVLSYLKKENGVAFSQIYPHVSGLVAKNIVLKTKASLWTYNRFLKNINDNYPLIFPEIYSSLPLSLRLLNRFKNAVNASFLARSPWLSAAVITGVCLGIIGLVLAATGVLAPLGIALGWTSLTLASPSAAIAVGFTCLAAPMVLAQLVMTLARLAMLAVTSVKTFFARQRGARDESTSSSFNTRNTEMALRERQPSSSPLSGVIGRVATETIKMTDSDPDHSSSVPERGISDPSADRSEFEPDNLDGHCSDQRAFSLH